MGKDKKIKIKNKCVAIIYHSNIFAINKEEWVHKCIMSIMGQTFQDFDVFELCYSEDKFQLWEGSNYRHYPLKNHIEAMNTIIDGAFDSGYEVVFNINLDDYYSQDRFELQLKYINEGYDLVSSNFQLVEELNGEDILGKLMEFHDKDIIYELNTSHNVICHPCIAMTKKFWETNKYYNPEQLGYEDMALWQRAINNGSKMIILPKTLCFYRQSPRQTGRVNSVQNGS